MIIHQKPKDNMPWAPNEIARRSRGRQAGIMLVECLVYVAVWLVIMGLGFGAMYRCRSNARDLRRSSEDISRTLKAGERWREDLRTAVGRPRLVEADGEQTLIVPRADGEVNYLFRDGAVFRQTAEGRQEEFLGQVQESHMVADARQQLQAWRWELELKTRVTNSTIRPLFTFEAVAKAGQKP